MSFFTQRACNRQRPGHRLAGTVRGSSPVGSLTQFVFFLDSHVRFSPGTIPEISLLPSETARTFATVAIYSSRHEETRTPLRAFFLLCAKVHCPLVVTIIKRRRRQQQLLLLTSKRLPVCPFRQKLIDLSPLIVEFKALISLEAAHERR